MFKVKDHYYQKAKRDNFLARSVYKLEEIDKRFKVISSGDQVVDLGYHPGSWIQYTLKKIGKKGKVTGIDIKQIQQTLAKDPRVTLLQESIFNIHGPSDLQSEKKFDVILSDMAPNTSGIKTVDQAKSLELVKAVFYLKDLLIEEGGHLVVKVFDSWHAQEFLKAQKKYFEHMHYLKPGSTRSTSKEFFVIAKNFRA